MLAGIGMDQAGHFERKHDVIVNLGGAIADRKA